MMIQNFTTLFKNLTLRSGVSLCSISTAKCSTLPSKFNENEKKKKNLTSDDFINKGLLLYNKENMERFKFDTYPLYVEREWWKEGSRMTFWATWRQLRDIRRRKAIAELGPQRIRYKALKENTVLPQALRDEMAEKLHNMDKNSRPKLVHDLCMFTGKTRGKIKRYGVSRHIFRKLADDSKLSGVQRAMW